MTRIKSLGRPDSLATRAYQAIRQAIRDDTLVHDHLYSEKELAELMSISRTPVREALIELSREGLVEVVPQRGFRLRRLSADEEDEVFQLRALLESFVVQRLAADDGPKTVTSLRKLLDEQESAAADPATFLTIDERFHLLMPSLAGLARTQQLLGTLRGMLWLAGGKAIATPHRRPEVLAEHRAIVDAIEAGDGDAAADALRVHLRNTQQAIAASRAGDAVSADASGDVPARA